MLRVALISWLVCHGAAQMKPGCLMAHCAKEMGKAVLDPKFYKNAACELGCQNNFDKDLTPEKLQYQNCTTTCAVTYETPAGDAFLACAMNNNCVSFPDIPGHCPYKKEHIQSDSSLASLAGEWWQHRGKNALWDCYDCQHIHSMSLSDNATFCAKTVTPGQGPVKAPCWSYTYSYDLYVTTGGTKTFEQTWQLPGDVAKGEQIDIYYNYMGSWHNESWFLLKATDNYVLLGDCSYMMSWINVGSIVWVRPSHVLTEKENAEIKEVYKSKLGWDFDDFCYDKHGTDNSGAICRNPASKTETFPARPRIFHHAPPGQKKPFLTPDQIDQLKLQMSVQLV